MQAVRRVLQRIKMRDTGRADALAEASTYAITHMQVGALQRTPHLCLSCPAEVSSHMQQHKAAAQPPPGADTEALHNVAFCA